MDKHSDFAPGVDVHYLAIISAADLVSPLRLTNSRGDLERMGLRYTSVPFIIDALEKRLYLDETTASLIMPFITAMMRSPAAPKVEVQVVSGVNADDTLCSIELESGIELLPDGKVVFGRIPEDKGAVLFLAPSSSITGHMAPCGLGISNLDRKIDAGLSKALRGRPGEVYGSHSGWDFNGKVWFADGLFHEEVWQYHLAVEVISAKTIRKLMDSVIAKCGSN